MLRILLVVWLIKNMPCDIYVLLVDGGLSRFVIVWLQSQRASSNHRRS